MNKRLIGFFVGLVALVLVIVISCVVFIIGDVSVEQTSNLDLQEEQLNSILEDSGVVKYSSIFGLDENIAMQNIESNNPFLKVVSIERKFPNKVIINVTDREPLLNVEIEENRYAILDRELKFLTVVETGDECLKNTTNISGVSISKEYHIGSFVKMNWLSSLIQEAERLSYINARFTTFIKQIEYRVTENGNLVLFKTNKGVSLVTYDTKDFLVMFNAAYTYYMEQLPENNKSNGYVVLADSAWTWVDSI